jgi:hypothetical protein
MRVFGAEKWIARPCNDKRQVRRVRRPADVCLVELSCFFVCIESVYAVMQDNDEIFGWRSRCHRESARRFIAIQFP